MCRLRAQPRARPAFSIIELLVVITVVAVLLAILLPALRGARGSARSVVCLSNLGGIGRQHAVWSGEHRDAWLNLFADDLFAPQQSYHATVNDSYYPRYGMQGDIWLLGLVEAQRIDNNGTLLSTQTPYEAYSCPVVFHEGIGLTDPDPIPQNRRPHRRALVSYHYSPTLSTDAKLWDPDAAVVNADTLDDPPYTQGRRLVRTSDVRHTSAKVAMAERADYHAKRITSALEPETEGLNALFTDGHAAHTPLADTVAPLPTVGFGFDTFAFVGTPDHPIRVPFRSTPEGHNGLDVRPNGEN